jgi:cytochrome P450
MAVERKYDLYSNEFRQNSHKMFAQMRAADPVFKQAGLFGDIPIWFVTRFADVEQVLMNDSRFVRDFSLVYSPEELAGRFGPQDNKIEAMLNTHMLNRDGEDHRRLRSIVSKAFTPKVIQAMRPRIQEIADHLLDQVAGGKHSMDLISSYAFPLPITVIAELLGIPPEDKDRFRIWSNAFVRPAIDEEEQAKALQLLTEFAVYMQALVQARKQQPGNDLLSGLILAEEQGDRLSQNELFSMLSLLIVAGHETTVSLIGNAVLALLQHPLVMETLRKDPSRMPAALEEFLRYDSPVERSLTRVVTEDTELAGQSLKRGDAIIAILGSANRDETRFKEAASLDIERKAINHLAFGKGSHYCLGAPLARLEGDIALNTLIQRFPGLRMAVPVEELVWRDVPLFHSLVSLPVEW